MSATISDKPTSNARCETGKAGPRASVVVPQLICPTLRFSEIVSRSLCKNISLPFSRKICFSPSIPRHKRGVRTSRNVGAGCGGRDPWCQTSGAGADGRNRVVPIPRSWDQVLRTYRSATVAKEQGTPRRSRISRKPPRGECRDVPAALLCLRAQSALFFVRKVRGCGQHPAFPAPSLFLGRHVDACLGRFLPRESERAPRSAV
jgi:hypothetical protein